MEEEKEKPELHTHLLAGWRFNTLIITVIITMLGYLLFTLWGGWDNVVYAVKEVGFAGIILGLTLALTGYTLRFLRWQIYLRTLNYRIPWMSSLRIYIAGFALSPTPGKAGEALRGVFLKDFGVEYRKSIGALLAERYADMLAVILIALGGLLSYPQARPLFFLVTTGVIGSLLILQKESWLRGIESFARRKLPTRFAHIIEFFIDTILALRSCYKPRILFIGLALGVLAWGMEGTAFYCYLTLAGAEVSFITAQFIYSFALIIGAITFLPGGIGAAEATMLQLLLVYDVPASLAVATIVLTRLTTLWFSVLLGLSALPKKNAYQQPAVDQKK